MTHDLSTSADAVVLIGNPRVGSRTRTLAVAVTEALLARLDAARQGVQVLELAEVAGVSFGPEPAYGSATVANPFEVVRSARLLVVATPAYKGSYTGLLKIFLDQLEHRALAGVVAVPVAVAASRAHAEEAAAALRGLLRELGAEAPAPPLAVLESRLIATGEVAGQWADRHSGLVAAASSGATYPA